MRLTNSQLRLPPSKLAETVVKTLLIDRADREFAQLRAERKLQMVEPWRVYKTHLPREPAIRAAARLTDAWLTSDQPIMETSDNQELSSRLDDLRNELILLRSHPEIPEVLREQLRTLPAPDADVLQLWVDLRDHLRRLLGPELRYVVSAILRALDVEAVGGLKPDPGQASEFYGVVEYLPDVTLTENMKNALTPAQYPSTRSQREWLRAAVDAALHDYHPARAEHDDWPVRTLVDLPWPPGETDRERAEFERSDPLDVVRNWLLGFAVDPVAYPGAEELVEDLLHERSWSAEFTVPPAGTPTPWSTASVRDLMSSTLTFARAAQDAGVDVATILADHRGRAVADGVAAPLVRQLVWLEAARTDDDAPTADEDAVVEALQELPAVGVLTFCHMVMRALLEGAGR